MVFIVGSGFFHWSAKYYFIHGSHSRIMWGVMAENLFMFVFVAVGLCLEQRRVSKRLTRPKPGPSRQLLQIVRTWAVLALAVVFIGRGVDHYFYPKGSSGASTHNAKKEKTMQEEIPIRAAIRNFVSAISNHEPKSDEINLIETGVIDSIRVLDLLNFVADTFHIEIRERDIYDGHFASIQSIASLVVGAVPRVRGP
jgi:acyl carrier protein